MFLAKQLIGGDRKISSSRINWDEAIENAVDAVENMVYRRALDGDIIAAIFYLKAQRPKFRDRLNINVEQVQSEIDEMIERFRENPGLLNPVSSLMLKE